MLFVILLFVASCISVEEEHVEFEPFPDYYAMLNVSHEASMKEIKRSFRKLAMGYHPDKNKSEGAQMIFQELSEAYSVLGDAEKKAEYDELFKHFYDISENDVHENQADNSDNSDNSEKEDTPAEDLKAEDDQGTADAPSTEKDDASSTVKDEGSSTVKDEAPDAEENSDEMDDETLFKVLKFLAENDYIITKRTKRTPSNNEESFNNSEDETRRKRSTDSTNTRNYSEYRTGSQNSSGQRGHTGGHHGHDHAWTHSHQHKPRSEHQNARYSNQFHGSEQVYCRTNIRWEGNVKITSKTCL